MLFLVRLITKFSCFSRHCNKLEEENAIMSAETLVSQTESQYATSVNDAYNDAWKQVQDALSSMPEMFSSLLAVSRCAIELI